MKKLLLAVFVSLVASTGFAQVDEPTDADIEKMMQAYKAFKAKQNATPKEEANPQARYERALLEAAKEGNASQVRGLLEQGINPNVKDEYGNTPLIYAARTSLPAVDMLLYAGADVNAKNKNGFTPLINSLYNEQENAVPIIKRLLQAKPDMNVVYKKQEDNFEVWDSTALLLAVVRPYVDAELFAQMLKQGADATQRLCGFGSSYSVPLSNALESKDPVSFKKAELLLQAGADPYLIESYEGKTPLDYANASGDKAKIKLIKDAMAATKAQRKKDEALVKASKKGDVEKVKKLLAEGANPNAYVYSYKSFYRLGNGGYRLYAAGDTSLTAAKDAKVAKILLDAGANVNSRDEYSCNTALFDEKDKQDLEIDKLLIKAGADVNVRNYKGATPLIVILSEAATTNYSPEQKAYAVEKAWLLLKAGADPSIRGNNGYGPLAYASMLQDKALVKEMMKRGARLSDYEKQGVTAYLNSQAQGSASGASGDGDESIGKTFLKGVVNTGVSALEYSLTK